MTDRLTPTVRVCDYDLDLSVCEIRVTNKGGHLP